VCCHCVLCVIACFVVVIHAIGLTMICCDMPGRYTMHEGRGARRDRHAPQELQQPRDHRAVVQSRPAADMLPSETDHL
jgi:hypothetical protein